MVVISAVEQIIPAWQITSLDNVRPCDQILGIFVRSENQKIFNYQKNPQKTQNKLIPPKKPQTPNKTNKTKKPTPEQKTF